MANKILSIVIPVYNVEKYIRKCLDSLIVSEDLMKLLDIVIINDGTPDNSAEIAREYEARYPDIFRVIDQENRGHGGAWNHGTELAAGKYLFYLDSDDWFDTSEFSKLLDCLKEIDTDLVLLDKTIFHAYEHRNEIHVRQNMNPWEVYDANSYDWLHSGNGATVTFAHDTIYRTSMMQKHLPLFCEHVMYDDVSLQVIPICLAESFIYVPFNVYHYLLGRSGQSFDPKVRSKHCNHITLVIKFVLSWLKHNRDMTPEGSMRRAWAEDNYSAFSTHHYREIMLFMPYRLAKESLASWDQYIRDNYSDVEPTPFVRSYRRYPFPCFYVVFKIKRFLERSARFVKRKMNSLIK